MENKRLTGSIHEKAAASYLEKQGYNVIFMNYRCKAGEIDVIFTDDTYLVFGEVKYRSSIRYGYPEEAVNYRKQRRIRNSAGYFILQHHIDMNTPIRFDVIAILGTKINHIKDAF